MRKTIAMQVPEPTPVAAVQAPMDPSPHWPPPGSRVLFMDRMADSAKAIIRNSRFQLREDYTARMGPSPHWPFPGASVAYMGDATPAEKVSIEDTKDAARQVWTDDPSCGKCFPRRVATIIDVPLESRCADDDAIGTRQAYQKRKAWIDDQIKAWKRTQHSLPQCPVHIHLDLKVHDLTDFILLEWRCPEE